MITNSSCEESALSRIATILNNPSSRAKPKVSEHQEAPMDAIQPVPQPLDPQRQQQEQIYYSMRIPLITPSLLFDMEAHLPGLVAFMASLQGRPAARSTLMGTIDETKRRNQSFERANNQENLETLAEIIFQDAFGGGRERSPVAVAALAIGAFMAGYTVAHNWPK